MENVFYKMHIEDVLSALNTTENGLTDDEVKLIQEKNGFNVLVEEKAKSVFRVFLSQFCDLLVIILIIASIISMISGNIESAIVILIVIIMNSIIGTVQYVKAQKSLQSLKNLSSPFAKVLRNGTITMIKAKDVVPGDIISIEAGDLVVADARIIHNFSLQVNESSLTGESTPIDKIDDVINIDTALADRKNMIYSGSLVTYGRAVAVITATGMMTEIGKIAKLMNSTKSKKTPLEESLEDFSKKLAIFIMIICLCVFIVSILRKDNILDALLFSVALAVAAIPEALTSIVTIVQAFGTSKMAKEKAVIKELKAVESLGAVSVICSDKTGTLTQNKMTVQNIFVNNETINCFNIDNKDTATKLLLINSTINNSSSFKDGIGIGDPTEYALLEAFQNIVDDECKKYCSIEELPFDSNRKMMSTKCKIDEKQIVFVKGAIDVILDRTNKILINNNCFDLTIDYKNIILKQNQIFSENGLRVLCFAYKLTNEKLTFENEKDFTFLGLVSMMDPPRSESVSAVHDAKIAHIKPIMITGDHKVTATAIAKKIGIFEDGDLTYTGMELDNLTDEEFYSVIEKISVYARVSPENKIRIVDMWQKKGQVVSMTGDGVNDAPALKKADIGVAMGITGTEVAKDASSMILMDDNFATIMKAVLNGRNVYRNIKNSILFLLSGNAAAIFSVIFVSIMNLPLPFATIHLLFINLLTDSLPALAIGLEPADRSLLKEFPRDKNVGIMNKKFAKIMCFEGFILFIATITAYFIGLKISNLYASTMAFATLTLSRLFHGINCRQNQSIFTIGLFSNIYTIFAILVGLLLLSFILFTKSLHSIFSVVDLNIINVLQILILSLLPTIILQILKSIKPFYNAVFRKY